MVTSINRCIQSHFLVSGLCCPFHSQEHCHSCYTCIRKQMALFLASDALSQTSQQLGLITVCSSIAMMPHSSQRRAASASGTRHPRALSHTPFVHLPLQHKSKPSFPIHRTDEYVLGQCHYNPNPNQVKKEGTFMWWQWKHYYTYTRNSSKPTAIWHYRHSSFICFKLFWNNYRLTGNCKKKYRNIPRTLPALSCL